MLCQGRRNMNVPTIGQGPGGVGVFTGSRADGQGDHIDQTAQSDAPRSRPDAGFNWVGWFDLHGTGRIVNRSPASGGDGVMIVPSVVHVPTYTRAVHHAKAAEPAAHDAGPEAAAAAGTKAPPTEVQTRQAIDAYQRYGQAAVADHTPAKRAVA